MAAPALNQPPGILQPLASDVSPRAVGSHPPFSSQQSHLSRIPLGVHTGPGFLLRARKWGNGGLPAAGQRLSLQSPPQSRKLGLLLLTLQSLRKSITTKYKSKCRGQRRAAGSCSGAPTHSVLRVAYCSWEGRYRGAPPIPTELGPGGGAAKIPVI